MKMRLKYKTHYTSHNIIKSVTLISKLGHNVKFKWHNLFVTGFVNNACHMTSDHENETTRKDTQILQIN